MTVSRFIINLLDRCIDACTDVRDIVIAHDTTIPHDDPDDRLYVPTTKALAALKSLPPSRREARRGV
jgi:hypothetical protein